MRDFIKKNKKAMKWIVIVMAVIIIITWSQSSNEQKKQGENNEDQEVKSEETANESKQSNVIEEMMKQQEDTEEDLKPVKIPEYTSEPEGMPEIVFVKQDRHGRAYRDFNHSDRNVGMFIDKYGNIKEFYFDGEVNREYGEGLLPYLETIGDEGIVGKIKSEDMDKLYYYYEQLFRVDSSTLYSAIIRPDVIKEFWYYGFIPDGMGEYYTVMTGDWETAMPPDGGKYMGVDANAVRINLWLGEVLGMELPIVKE